LKLRAFSASPSRSRRRKGERAKTLNRKSRKRLWRWSRRWAGKPEEEAQQEERETRLGFRERERDGWEWRRVWGFIDRRLRMVRSAERNVKK